MIFCYFTFTSFNYKFLDSLILIVDFWCDGISRAAGVLVAHLWIQKMTSSIIRLFNKHG